MLKLPVSIEFRERVVSPPVHTGSWGFENPERIREKAMG